MHWRESLKQKKLTIGYERFDKFMDVVWGVVAIAILVIALAISYKVGYIAGEVECAKDTVELERLHKKGSSLAVQASDLMHRNQATVKSCLDVGRGIVEFGQRIK